MGLSVESTGRKCGETSCQSRHGVCDAWTERRQAQQAEYIHLFTAGTGDFRTGGSSIGEWYGPRRSVSKASSRVESVVVSIDYTRYLHCHWSLENKYHAILYPHSSFSLSVGFRFFFKEPFSCIPHRWISSFPFSLASRPASSLSQSFRPILCAEIHSTCFPELWRAVTPNLRSPIPNTITPRKLPAFATPLPDRMLLLQLRKRRGRKLSNGL
jgi:hypothetical protein